MKEAAGTAHITIITIILIGSVALVGGILISRLTSNINAKSCCQELGGEVSGNYCNNYPDNGEQTLINDLKNNDNCK